MQSGSSAAARSLPHGGQIAADREHATEATVATVIKAANAFNIGHGTKTYYVYNNTIDRCSEIISKHELLIFFG